MGKNKLKRFEENNTFPNLIQPRFEEVFRKDHSIKGNWNESFFKNDKPIVLELGCGKGEYTIGLSRQYPEKNFIGIDIKGARLWRGAKTAVEGSMDNVAFVRTRIENITSFFAKDEVSEIWITFPDPQLKRINALKRLTSSVFLGLYKTILKPNGLIHLKTDSQELHQYTKSLAELNELKVHHCTNDLYLTVKNDPILSIRTFYEQQFLDQGKTITYICFELSNEKPFIEHKYQRT
ncbi:MAG TPA: tRNA (guanosine(46)-N7)-methyltransferase TrmB [Bacteroidales bacterium]|nr:tRNA (guanosine(46)-N7)-methyltransferase TrmB [Bacteroidales bacterium]